MAAMNIFEIPEELTDELMKDSNKKMSTLKSVNTRQEAFVYEYYKNVLAEADKDELKYTVEYVCMEYSSDLSKVFTKYDIEYREEIVKKRDAYHTSIICLSNDSEDDVRLFTCDIDVDKYKYKMFEEEELSLLKIDKNKMVQLIDPKCYGICFLNDDSIKITLMVINIIEKTAKMPYKEVNTSEIDKSGKITLKKLDIVGEEVVQMGISNTFYKELLYEKKCSEEALDIVKSKSNVDRLIIMNDVEKGEVNYMESLYDASGNITRKYLQRVHERQKVQKNICKYFLDEYRRTNQIELLMDSNENMIKVFSYYFEDIYEGLKKEYNIDDRNNINMNNLKIMRTRKLHMNSSELICLIPLEEIMINTSDNMKYELMIGDIFVYYGEYLVLEKEISTIFYTIAIN